MSLFEDNSLPGEPPSRLEEHDPAPAPAGPSEAHSVEGQSEIQALATSSPALGGDPIALAATAPPVWSVPARPLTIPPAPSAELSTPWYWAHFLVFTVFSGVSLVLVQTVLLLHYVSPRSLTNQKEVERIILSKPLVAVGTMVIWYGLVLLFLYVTLSVFRGVPFWQALGWKKIAGQQTRWPKNPWLYLVGGCVLSALVIAATSHMKEPEDVPIQELFKYKNTAIMFMAMAVLVAPLVEETIFRGYLYPLFAKSFGMAASILITGTLFGMMHGAQLGWTWGLVSVLIVVGIVFTFVRASTGTVLASFLLHLGYNSTIALFTFLAMLGPTKIPSVH